MKKTSALFAVGILSLGIECPSIAATYPPLTPGQQVYVIPADQAKGLIIDTLYLPKGVTLKAGPGVTEIDWSVQHIRIEEDTTIDLSADPTKPPRGADAPARTPQADYHNNGGPGYSGGAGVPGKDGVNMRIHDVVDIANSGSLWFKTDGGPGGDGGNGGRGQQGGGHTNIHHAGAGGPGGPGGAAGRAGEVGNVSIVYRGSTTSAIANGVAPTCGGTERPAAAKLNSGVIVVYGGRGCPGVAGSNGPQGLGG